MLPPQSNGRAGVPWHSSSPVVKNGPANALLFVCTASAGSLAAAAIVKAACSSCGKDAGDKLDFL